MAMTVDATAGKPGHAYQDQDYSPSSKDDGGQEKPAHRILMPNSFFTVFPAT